MKDQSDPPDAGILSIRGPLGHVCWYRFSEAVRDDLLGCLSSDIGVNLGESY